MSAHVHTHADAHALHCHATAHVSSHTCAFGSFCLGAPLLQISILRLCGPVRNQSGAGACRGQSGKGEGRGRPLDVGMHPGCWNAAFASIFTRICSDMEVVLSSGVLECSVCINFYKYV